MSNIATNYYGLQSSLVFLPLKHIYLASTRVAVFFRNSCGLTSRVRDTKPWIPPAVDGCFWAGVPFKWLQTWMTWSAAIDPFCYSRLILNKNGFYQKKEGKTRNSIGKPVPTHGWSVTFLFSACMCKGVDIETSTHGWLITGYLYQLQTYLANMSGAGTM